MGAVVGVIVGVWLLLALAGLGALVDKGWL
jgi:hypothetical protein